MRSRPADTGAPESAWVHIQANGTVIGQGGSFVIRVIKGTGGGGYDLYFDPPLAAPPAVAVSAANNAVIDISESAQYPNRISYVLAVPGSAGGDIEHFVTVTGSRRR